MATVTPKPEAPVAKRLQWGDGGTFEAVDDCGEIRVIDSWLVNDGRTRAIDAHLRRFSAACVAASSADGPGVPAAGVPRAEAERFFRTALRQIPATGRWFPRAELALVNGTPRLRLWLRPAPPLAQSIRLWVPPEPDQRTCPHIKGADLAYLSALRDTAIAAGADEAVLMSPGGTVREGTTTSILWWRDEVLCAPPPDDTLLTSVTRAVLLETAAARAIPVTFEHATPAELTSLQVWAVNALHGIRPVTSWL
jgi:branched-subunit amino acid aminotransferase/4-amino-4-deoxychorismate lyase